MLYQKPCATQPELIYRREVSQLIEDVYVKYWLHDSNLPLVVIFSNARYPTRILDLSNPGYHPWGYRFIRKHGVNVLAFSCFESVNWYRSLIFHQYLRELAPVLQQKFPARIGYGSSLGGYATSAFADLLGLRRLLLLNPISTLNPDCVPWETRYAEARRNYIWDHSFQDGATTTSEGYIVYDPDFAPDAQHAKRYNKKFIHLCLPGVEHGMPVHLKKLGILKPLVTDFIFDTLDLQAIGYALKNRLPYAGKYVSD